MPILIKPNITCLRKISLSNSRVSQIFGKPRCRPWFSWSKIWTRLKSFDVGKIACCKMWLLYLDPFASHWIVVLIRKRSNGEWKYKNVKCKTTYTPKRDVAGPILNKRLKCDEMIEEGNTLATINYAKQHMYFWLLIPIFFVKGIFSPLFLML